MVNDIEFLYAVEASNTLGEGVLWNARTQTVWWTDIEEACLFEYAPATGALRHWKTPHRVACFGFIEGSADLMVAFDRGIAVYAPETGAVDWRVGPGVLPDGLRFNDGRVDARGRLWVGTMVEGPVAPPGGASLYCHEPGRGLVEHLRGITISNGLCWSSDGTVMYHADSPRNLICAYGFDMERGAVADRRVFAETPPGIHPDGSVTDSEGGVWNAQWGGGRIVRYTAGGAVDRVLETPASQPTCVAFGGPDLDLLFVTSARAGLGAARLAAEPQAGSLFVYRTAFRGLPAPDFKPR